MIFFLPLPSQQVTKHHTFFCSLPAALSTLLVCVYRKTKSELDTYPPPTGTVQRVILLIRSNASQFIKDKSTKKNTGRSPSGLCTANHVPGRQQRFRSGFSLHGLPSELNFPVLFQRQGHSIFPFPWVGLRRLVGTYAVAKFHLVFLLFTFSVGAFYLYAISLPAILCVCATNDWIFITLLKIKMEKLVWKRICGTLCTSFITASRLVGDDQKVRLTAQFERCCLFLSSTHELHSFWMLWTDIKI